MEYYFSKLTSTEKKQYQKVLTAIRNNETCVKFSMYMNKDIVTKVISAVAYDHPELFYVDLKKIRYVNTPLGIAYYIDYSIKSVLRNDAINNMENKINAALKELKIKESDSDMDKCRKIHNYLINHVHYCYEALSNPEAYPEVFNIRGVFEESKAVCEGISKAFKILADRLGIECLIVNGMSAMEGFSEKIPHAWNVVKIGNLYSHIDVTWNLGASESSKKIRYDYFMVPDEWISTDHDYTDLPECKTYTYSYFVQKQCIFDGIKTLKIYLEKEIKSEVQILYFKIVGKQDLPEDIADRIHKLVAKMLSNYRTSSYSMEMLPNYKQNVFFIKIKN